jgi:hypothetical protein
MDRIIALEDEIGNAEDTEKLFKMWANYDWYIDNAGDDNFYEWLFLRWDLCEMPTDFVTISFQEERNIRRSLIGDYVCMM